MALNPKQQAFVNEYLIDLNSTQAAIRAGYAVKTAAQIGYQNLQKPEIQAAIAEGMKKRTEQTGIDANWVLTELAKQYKKADELAETNTSLKALDLIGKHVGVGAFNNKLELSGSLQISHEQALDELDD